MTRVIILTILVFLIATNIGCRGGRSNENNARTIAYYTSHKEKIQEMYHGLQTLHGRYNYYTIGLLRRMGSGPDMIVTLATDSESKQIACDYTNDGRKFTLTDTNQDWTEQQRAQYNKITNDPFFIHLLEVNGQLENSVMRVEKSGVYICMDIPSMMVHDEQEYALIYMPFSKKDASGENIRITAKVDSNVYLYERN